jgi:hypothetical protein
VELLDFRPTRTSRFETRDILTKFQKAPGVAEENRMRDLRDGNTEGPRPAPHASKPAIWLALAAAVLPAPALAWTYAEHRAISARGIEVLEPPQRQALDILWANSREGNASRLCAEPGAGEQGAKPSCIDLAAWPAIAGDHSCSPKELLQTVLTSDWILDVVATRRAPGRLFAGWDFEPEEINRANFAAEGYRRGVPMGGELRAAPGGKAPVFLIRALRDPDGANLDRIQVIKGWLDAKGETHERIYDVAVSDSRKIDAEGRCKTPVGNNVDVPNATYSNTIGAPLLGAYWRDPNFNPKERAFYYVRVLEIPTPRWTAYDAKFYGIQMSKEVPMTLQERAYTSPIWYTPGK